MKDHHNGLIEGNTFIYFGDLLEKVKVRKESKVKEIGMDVAIPLWC